MGTSTDTLLMSHRFSLSLLNACGIQNANSATFLCLCLFLLFLRPFSALRLAATSVIGLLTKVCSSSVATRRRFVVERTAKCPQLQQPYADYKNTEEAQRTTGNLTSREPRTLTTFIKH